MTQEPERRHFRKLLGVQAKEVRKAFVRIFHSAVKIVESLLRILWAVLLIWREILVIIFRRAWKIAQAIGERIPESGNSGPVYRPREKTRYKISPIKVNVEKEETYNWFPEKKKEHFDGPGHDYFK